MDKLKISKFVAFLIIFLTFGFFSCSKDSYNTSNTSENGNEEVVQEEMEEVSDTDLTETDEDLLKVDYKEFYDELAPHGEWIEVTDSDLGLDMQKSSSSIKTENKKITFSELFGVNDAYADDMSFGTFFVWRPAAGLAVSLNTGDAPAAYVPYTNGQWVNTDAGWYFRAPTPHEEIVHHHGRWLYTPSQGWIWMPGRVWAPAWVDWREQDDYVAWTPVPPKIYIVNDIVTVPSEYEVADRYVVVERRYFAEPNVYRYFNPAVRQRIVLNQWRRLVGLSVMNRRVINRGPDVTVINTYTNNNLEPVKINKVKNIKQVSYSPKEYTVYSPQFKKAKVKRNINRTVTRPNNYAKYTAKGNDKKIESSGNKNNPAVKPNLKTEGQNKSSVKTKEGQKQKVNYGNKNLRKNNNQKMKQNNIKKSPQQKSMKYKKSGNDGNAKQKGKRKENNEKLSRNYLFQ